MCIKLVIKTNLYYDARSEKHQIMQILEKPPEIDLKEMIF
jgi:hypothetical protein